MRRSWGIGLVLGLAALSGEAAVQGQGVGTSNGTAPAATGVGSSATGWGGGPVTVPRGRSATNFRGSAPAVAPRSRSYNRVTTVRRDVVSAPSRPSVASGMMPQEDPLHPYSNQVRLAQAGRSDSETPAGSTRQPAPRRPESQPVIVRSTPHNYYPGMRIGQHPNANTAQVSRGRTGIAPRICVPNRGQALAGAVGAGTARGR